ncbi:complex I subunit 5 family protein [Trujillonella humicola]|uniref:complex I subunit 5 family protein n=1 Tax=Trujillonella humicola TaxID=3383699 RepID=UPI003905B9C8
MPPSLVVAVPLAAVLLTAVLRSAALVRPVAAAGALATAAAVGAVALAPGATPRESLGGWEAPLGIPLVVGDLSAVLLVMTAVVGLAVTAYALAERREGAFWPLWFGVWLALDVVFVAADAFTIYVGFEVLALSAVGLVALAGGVALQAALRYLFVTVLGSLLYLLAVALLYADRGTLAFATLAETPGSPAVAAVALAAVTVGMMLKCALLPLHGWLPEAHGGAPAPVSPVLSALVVKGALFVLVLYWFTLLPGTATLPAAGILGSLGAVAALWGAWMALRQERLKLVVAYSTIAQIGQLFLVFPLATPGSGADAAGLRAAWVGAFTLLVAHGFAKAAMFLAAGALAAAHGTDRLPAMAGATARHPLAVAAFALAGLSLAGLPPSLGFTGKYLLLQSSVQTGRWYWAVPLVVAGVMTAAYVFRVVSLTFDRSTVDRPRRRLSESPGREVPAVALAVLAVVLGFTGAGLTGRVADSVPPVVAGAASTPASGPSGGPP